MHLVLTKLDFEYVSDQDFMFLGAWCLDYSLKPEHLDLLEKKILPYPFDDPNLSEKSFEYLNSVDNYLFPHFAEALNRYHKVNFSNRYWRILAGHWWRTYIDILFERYTCLKNAHVLTPKATVFVLSEKNYVTPETSPEFANLYKGDLYNWQLYSQLITLLGFFDTKKIEIKKLIKKTPRSPFSKKNLKKTFLKLVMFIFKRNKNIYFASVYMPTLLQLCLGLKLKFIPARYGLMFEKNLHIDSNENTLFFSSDFFRDEFESLVIKILDKNCPAVFLQNYTELLGFTKKYYPNQACKFVMTSTRYSTDDGFKCFAANQIELYHAKYIIFQHGGGYGVDRWSSIEDYEIDVSDYYVTFGWKNENAKLIPIAFPNSFNFKKKFDSKNKKNILLILASSSRYTYLMCTTLLCSQFVYYLRGITDFLNLLPENIKQKLVCRPYLHNHGWHDLAYIEQHSGKLAYVKANSSCYENAKMARLVICTYNSTTCLEMFSANIPTLFYWKPEFSLLRPEAEKIYNLLHEIGVLHYDPVSLVHHIDNIYVNTEAWWFSDIVQHAREKYCYLYAKKPENYCGKLTEFLSSI